MNEWWLNQLLSAAGLQPLDPAQDRIIRQITDDSRDVGKDSLFVAVRGTRTDGHQFIEQAVRNGAKAVLVEKSVEVPTDLVQIQVDSTRRWLGPLVGTFWGCPSRRLKVVGITGTNGKTTVSWILQHLLQSAGIPCGLIGTICHRIGGQEILSTNTTPGVVSLQGILARMAENGLQVCSMEVSSHALDQQRTDGIRWACGVFTNFSGEHLDYHQTLEEYLRAKLQLFESLPPAAAAVINKEDPVWENVRGAAPGRIFTYALESSADLSAREIHCSMEGTSCRLLTPEGIFPIRWGLVGRHNIQNLLAALGAVMAIGVPVRQVIRHVGSFSGVPGRLERVEAGQSFPVFVDYAHTDGALRVALQQMRAMTDRKILVVFGCGGDRDKGKRPRMGRVAAEMADRVIITSDNPRSEELADIAEEVAAGIPKSMKGWEQVLDRREAIQTALESADAGWVVLIAGKGHETGQTIGAQVIPFDDREVVKECFNRLTSQQRPARF